MKFLNILLLFTLLKVAYSQTNPSKLLTVLPKFPKGAYYLQYDSTINHFTVSEIENGDTLGLELRIHQNASLIKSDDVYILSKEASPNSLYIYHKKRQDKKFRRLFEVPDGTYCKQYFFITFDSSVCYCVKHVNGVSFIFISSKNQQKMVEFSYLENDYNIFGAVRHANGRDWWIITHPKEFSNKLHAFLVCENELVFDKLVQFTPFYQMGNTIGTIVFSDYSNLFSTFRTGYPPMLELFELNRRNFDINSIFRDTIYYYKYGRGFTHYGDFDKHGNFYIGSAFAISPFDHSVNFPEIYSQIFKYSKNGKLDSLRLPINYFYSQVKSYGVNDLFIVDSTLYAIVFLEWGTEQPFHARTKILKIQLRENKPFHALSVPEDIDTSFTFDYFIYEIYRGPNYKLRPELNIGFESKFLSCTERCGYHVTFKDTSCCHFYRLWDFGDGTQSDTLWVTQHAELLGKVDTFQTVTHTYARPGRYKVTLQILNPYDYGEHLPPGVFLKDTLEKWIDVPFCSKAAMATQSNCNKTLKVNDLHCGAYDEILYDYGDGSPLTSDSTHVYAAHGVYVVTQILRLDTFYSTFSQTVVVPDCIEPSVEHAETACVSDSLVVKYTGTRNYNTLYLTEPQALQGSFVGDSIVLHWEGQFPSGPITLWFSASNATYDTTWSSLLTLLDCDELWIPNAFSPNHDGVNDVFSYVCRGCVWNQLKVFNRDAQPIYSCEGATPCVWKGNTERGVVEEGVYVYRLKVRKWDGREVERIGTVTVLR